MICGYTCVDIRESCNFNLDDPITLHFNVSTQTETFDLHKYFGIFSRSSFVYRRIYIFSNKIDIFQER